MSSVAFVDSRVQDIETLLAGIGPDTPVFILDSDRDGVVQMAEMLGGVSDLDPIHVVPQGISAALCLDFSLLTNENKGRKQCLI
jgi:Domain of unknown function (DUF4347)